jgi:hypothetical protein
MKYIISNVKSKLLFLPMLLLLVLIEFAWTPPFGNVFTKNAEAVVGRPASPGSVAGTARRVRRRTVRRVAVGTRVTTVPAGCQSVIKYGTKYELCDGTYYKPTYEGNEVVYIVENPKP